MRAPRGTRRAAAGSARACSRRGARGGEGGEDGEEGERAEQEEGHDGGEEGEPVGEGDARPGEARGRAPDGGTGEVDGEDPAAAQNVKRKSTRINSIHRC